MAVFLDHMTVYTRDKMATAEFYAQVFGATPQPLRRDFAPVQINEGLTLNLEEAESFKRGHYAFRVAGPEFDAIRERLQTAGVTYGSTTAAHDNQIYVRGGLRGLYFDDPNGHGLEVIAAE
jgi:catechol 2,3-dioxygenase-like lactoylglutathione lyase family enzyme